MRPLDKNFPDVARKKVVWRCWCNFRYKEGGKEIMGHIVLS